MNDEQQKQLERPFETSVIKKRRGPGGKELSYVSVAEYVKRLNSVFGSDWSFELTGREHLDSQVLVEGRLTAGGVIKGGIGGAEIRRSRDGAPGSLSDAFKSASSDCLKRCCRLLGIGLSLYGDDEPPANTPTAEFGNSSSNGPGGRISRAQLDKLRELVGELGAQWPSFKGWVKTEHGVAIEYATRQLASDLIGELIGKVHARKGNGIFQTGGVQ